MEKGKGCTCKADLKKEVKEMVTDVEGYTKADHDKKRKELNDAFGKSEHHAAAPAHHKEHTAVHHKEEHHKTHHKEEHHKAHTAAKKK